MKNLLIALFLLANLTAYTQSSEVLSVELKWTEKPFIHSIYPDADTELPQFAVYAFDGADYKNENPSLPYFTTIVPVASYGRLNVQLSNEVWETFDKEVSNDDAVLSENISIKSAVHKERSNHLGSIAFIPIRKTGSNFERLTSFDLRINFTPENYPLASERTDYTYTSVFADADENEMYKIPISKTGIYRLDKAYLEELGINTSSIDPTKIKIFGNGGGALVEYIDTERLNDLEENPIKVIGENDGNFNENDAVIFYAEGPHKWIFNENEQAFNRETNIYTKNNYYYLKIDSSNGLRVSDAPIPSLNGETYSTSEFNDYQTYEEDIVNLLDAYTSGQGTGKKWFGDSFKLQREKTYSNIFNFANITNDTAQIKVSFAGRADNQSTKFSVAIAGNTFSHSSSFSSLNLSNIDGTYATQRQVLGKFITNNSNPDIEISYPNVGSSEGWLDYITMNVRRKLQLVSDNLTFRDINSSGESVTKYTVANAENVEIWDITNPLKAKLQEVAGIGNSVSFGTATEAVSELKEYVAFRTNGALNTPSIGTRVAAQNLHSFDNVDLLIVYHSEFKNQAEQLAEHRANFSDLDVALADVNQIYNEFSSGKLDPGAIREMGKMLYERNPDKFKYMLLLGDGSFDARNIKNEATVHNYIPVYETTESLNPISGFPSDDFFGLISEGEGTGSISGFLDIAIGRMPVRTTEQAQAIIDKIIHYDNTSEVFGDWRNRVTFVADNGDGNRHMADCDAISEGIREQNKNLNLDKIFIDSYDRVATTGDARVPGATEALNNNIFKGQLAIVYLGHGGSGGWTQERILTKDDIYNWENYDALPVFITATCSFAGFDEPSNVTAGEEVFLNEGGGAVGLLTTVRPVFANANAALTENVTDILFQKIDNEVLPLGEVMRQAKNNTGSGNSANPRKFLMLGDPSQKLALPTYNIATTKVNGIAVSETQLDTISALEKVTIEGEIRDENNELVQNFNGILYPTLYDKIKTLSTLGQTDDSPARSYLLRKNVIFKGRASVTNGKFSFTFVVPKDIDYSFGAGKISYYAEDESMAMDATGASCDVVIGGIDETAEADDEGPQVEVFMNTFDWISGGMTNENPILLARLSDDNGINVVGNSIGHDLTGLLDNDSQNSYLLNDFYEAELDDYTSGTLRFPLKNISVGHHEIKVKGWDTANNSAEGITEFVVASSAKMALTEVLNYPNPFVNNTCFMFNINQSGDLDVLVSIYTISGRLVKTLEETIFNVEQQVSLGNCIEWDGKDDFGDDLAQGVYLYKVRVRNQATGVVSDKKESEFEKLVIIK